MTSKSLLCSRHARRRPLAAVAALALALGGLLGVATPAQAVDFTNTGTTTNGDLVTFKITNLRSANPLYAYAGDKVTASYYFKFFSGKKRAAHIKCTSAGTTWQQSTGYFSTVTAAVTMTVTAGATYSCSGWMTIEGNTTKYHTKSAAFTGYPFPVAPRITLALTGAGSITAGATRTGSFDYSHTTPPPYAAPTVQWSVTPSNHGGTFTATGKSYSFAPRVAAEAGTIYTLQARVLGGYANPGTIQTETRITVMPAAPTSLTWNPSTLNPARNTTVTISGIAAKDTYGNIVSSGNAVTFTSSNTSDTVSGTQIVIGSQPGVRTITGKYATITSTKTLTVNASPVAGPTNLGTIRAGDGINRTLTINAYPMPVSITCTDLPKGLAIQGLTLVGTPTVAGEFAATCETRNDIGAGEPLKITGTVVAGVGATLTLAPDKTTANPGQTIRLNPTVVDSWGNVVPSSEYTLALVASNMGGDTTNPTTGSITPGDTPGPRSITVAAIPTGAMSPLLAYATITVSSDAGPKVGWVTIQAPAGMVNATVGVPTAVSVAVTSGATTTLASGMIPPGLSLSKVDARTWKVAGTPQTAGVYGFMLRAATGSGSAETMVWMTVAPGSTSGSQVPQSQTSSALTLQPGGVVTGPDGAVVPGTAKTLKVGATLTIPTQLIPAGWKASYQWFRNGKTIKGATSRTFKIRPRDAGQILTAQLTLTNPATGEKKTITLNTKKVPRIKPTLTVQPSLKGGRLELAVKVKAKGLPNPTGKITAKVGASKKTITLRKDTKGKTTISMRIPPGENRLTVKYKGNTNLKPRTATGSVAAG
ncbi:MAG: hypothetical protein FWD59_05450 [Micrococcales bacterium]|nr:hypothetical protein [Micrococcales bacterium]